MKYIFIDTNIFIVSAISTQAEHKIESFEKLKNILKSSKAKLLVPEIVKIEFERKIDELHEQIKQSFGKLEDTIKQSKFNAIPFLEDEKNELTKTVSKISKEKELKFKRMITEIKELFSSPNVDKLPLTPAIFVSAYLRCMRKEKPFKKKDEKELSKEFEIFQGNAWLNDALIVETLLPECKRLTGKKDSLIFCSNNIEDYAAYDEDLKKHVLHSDIKKDINIDVIYYRHLPEMIKKEFKEPISKKTTENDKQVSEFLKHLYVLDNFNSDTNYTNDLEQAALVSNIFNNSPKNRNLLAYLAAALPINDQINSGLKQYRALQTREGSLLKQIYAAFESGSNKTGENPIGKHDSSSDEKDV